MTSCYSLYILYDEEKAKGSVRPCKPTPTSGVYTVIYTIRAAYCETRLDTLNPSLRLLSRMQVRTQVHEHRTWLTRQHHNPESRSKCRFPVYTT